MKKYLPVSLAIILGIFLGNFIFNSYDEQEVMTSDGNIYFLQYGAYSNKEVLLDNTKRIKDNYIVLEQDKTYYIYLGLTTDYNNALTIKKIYKGKGIFLYIKNEYLSNTELISKIKEMDQLIIESNDDNTIYDYNQKMISFYKKVN